MNKILLLVSAFIFTCASAIAQKSDQHFNGITLQPTIAYINYHSEARRMVRLLFRNGK
ncbi:MAG: hypothetical protein JWO06_2115, partial [Bacteroidota bacterium]|nr:hypothetical protein [Bacteroidota bacterium]